METEISDLEWDKFVKITTKEVQNHPDQQFDRSLAQLLGSSVSKNYERYISSPLGLTAPLNVKVRYLLNVWSCQNGKSWRELIADFDKLLAPEETTYRLRMEVAKHFISKKQVQRFDKEDAMVIAISWALFKTLQSRGIDELSPSDAIQSQLKTFVRKKKRRQTNITYDVMDFDCCKIFAWINTKQSDFKIYKLLIENVKERNFETDFSSFTQFHFEHVLVYKRRCMRVINEFIEDGKRFFLCRQNHEAEISPEKLEVVDANRVDMIYRIDTVEAK